MKLDYEVVLFTDECRATRDRSKGWDANGNNRPIRVRRRQGGGGIMFWAGINGNELVGPYKVPEVVNMTSVAYVAFLKEHLEPWFKSKPLSLKRKIIFIYDNAPSHAANTTVATNKRSVSKMVVSCCETSGASARGMYMFLAGNFQRKRNYGMPYPQQGIFL